LAFLSGRGCLASQVLDYRRRVSGTSIRTNATIAWVLAVVVVLWSAVG
jgi:hypothetical protein